MPFAPMEVPKNEPVEFVFGLAGPVGADFGVVSGALSDALRSVEYSTEVIRLSSFLRDYKLSAGLYPITLTSTFEDERIRSHQDAGNALRDAVQDNAALAIRGIRAVSESRLKRAGGAAQPGMIAPTRHAYILHSLKRPEEVDQLRSVYNGGFYLIAVVAPRSLRIANLAKRIARSRNSTAEHAFRTVATELVDRDELEDSPYGQKLSDTFPTADLFVSFGDGSAKAEAELIAQIDRFLRLIMGANDTTPTPDEAAMFHAYGAGMRSGSLARQVGAALLSRLGEVLSVGCNDVPAAGGGIYWQNDHYDHRDIKKPRDSSDAHEEEMVHELLNEFEKAKWCPTPPDLPAAMWQLRNTRMMNLLEFSRALHAEMEAILAAGRVGVSTQDTRLYTTTFPCHECAKLIIGAGIAEVLYIEPYAKSRVVHMFQHEIATEPFDRVCRNCGTASLGETRCHNCDGTNFLHFGVDGRCTECGAIHRIPFRPFVGIGPRRYLELFAMISTQGAKFKRKDDLGNRLPWIPAQRRPMLPLSYLEKESLVVDEFRQKFDAIRKKGETNE